MVRPEEMIVWSQTRLKATACPFRGQAIIDRVGPGMGSPVAELGTVIHAFAKEYIAECRELERTTNTSSVDRLIEKAIAAHPLRPILRADASDLAWKFAEGLIVPATTDGHVEWTLEADLNWTANKPPRWRGTLDSAFLDGAVWHLDDWKSGWRLASESECEADIQLPFYASLVLAHYPNTLAFKCQYHFLRYGEVRELTLSAEEIKEVWRPHFKSLADNHEALSTYPAQPGSHCDWCEVVPSCPIEKRDIAPITDEREAAAAAELWRVLKRHVSILDRSLRAWCDSHGSVQVGDQAVGFWPAPSKSFEDAKAVFDMLVTGGIPEESVWRQLGISQSSVKTLLPKGEWGALRQKALGLLEERTSPKFMAKRRTQDAIETPDTEELALP